MKKYYHNSQEREAQEPVSWWMGELSEVYEREGASLSKIVTIKYGHTLQHADF